jgi:hypothetical protein
VTRGWWVVALAVPLGVLADLAVGASTPGLTAATGLLGGFALILGSKALGKALLKRPEAYYDPPTATDGIDHRDPSREARYDDQDAPGPAMRPRSARGEVEGDG